MNPMKKMCTINRKNTYVYNRDLYYLKILFKWPNYRMIQVVETPKYEFVIFMITLLIKDVVHILMKVTNNTKVHPSRIVIIISNWEQQDRNI